MFKQSNNNQTVDIRSAFYLVNGPTLRAGDAKLAVWQPMNRFLELLLALKAGELTFGTVNNILNVEIGVGDKADHNTSIKTVPASIEAITKLINEWRHHARRLIWDAPKDKSMITATQAMEHDAIIYINCIRELSEALGITTTPEPLAPPEPSAK